MANLATGVPSSTTTLAVPSGFTDTPSEVSTGAEVSLTEVCPLMMGCSLTAAPRSRLAAPKEKADEKADVKFDMFVSSSRGSTDLSMAPGTRLPQDGCRTAEIPTWVARGAGCSRANPPAYTADVAHSVRRLPCNPHSRATVTRGAEEPRSIAEAVPRRLERLRCASRVSARFDKTPDREGRRLLEELPRCSRPIRRALGARSVRVA